jgi:hypothetical protein
MRRRKPSSGLSKYEVRKMVTFALNHLPQLDENTLESFMDRINANYGTGRIKPHELASQIQRTGRFYSQACPYTLQVLADLIDVQLKNPNATTEFLRMGVFAAEDKGQRNFPANSAA